MLKNHATFHLYFKTAASSRISDSTNNEERSINLVRGRGIRERVARDRNSSSSSGANQPQQLPSGLRLVANLRGGDSQGDPLAELLSQMANSRAVIYDSGQGRSSGRGVVGSTSNTTNQQGALPILSQSGGSSTVAAQLEQQLQSARSLLEELQHLERLPQTSSSRNMTAPLLQNRGGNVVVISGGGLNQAQQQNEMKPTSTTSTPQNRQLVLNKWCEERERSMSANLGSSDDQKSRAYFVQEVLLGLMTASCKETIL